MVNLLKEYRPGDQPLRKLEASWIIENLIFDIMVAKSELTESILKASIL